MVSSKLSQSSLSLSDFLARLSDVSEERDGWVAKCPAHDDSHASLRVTVSADSGKVLLKDRATCTASEIMAALGLTMKDLMGMDVDVEPASPAASSSAPPAASDLADLATRLDGYASALHSNAGDRALAYAAQRFGVEPDLARKLGLGLATDLGGGARLVVPFRNLSGQAQGFQARALNKRADIRWAGPPNPTGASWAPAGFFHAGSGWAEVIITEGPGDALTAVAAGYDAIAIRGAGLVSNEATIDYIVGLLQDRVAIVAGDADPAGRKFNTALVAALKARGITTKVLQVAEGKDLTDWRAADPGFFKRGIHETIQALEAVQRSSKTEWPESIYSLSDLGAARFLRDRLEGQNRSLRYTVATGFLQLENGIWTKKNDTQVRTEAHSIVGDGLIALARMAYEEAQATGNAADQQWARKLAGLRDHVLSTRGMDSVLKELKSVAGIFADIEDFDRHPYLLAFRNGVVDLRTAELKPHDPALLLTRRVEHDFDPSAKAPRWEQFLQEVFPDQPEMAEYIQRLVGYGITGATDEQCFVVHYGVGSNGKSIFTDTLSEIFEPITTTTPFSTFERRQGDGVPNDLAALAGARLVMAPEGNQGKMMDEALLKRVTGRDKIAARFLRREFFEFRPQFLLMMASNYRPAFMGQDEGLWRRVKLIEWRRHFSVDERDPKLPDKLLAETPGIIAWAVAGAVKWAESGLQEPEAITEVTNHYRIQSDVLNGFLPGEYEKGEDTDFVPRSELFRAFQDYADEGNFRDLAGWSSRAFYRAVEERGYPAHRRNGTIGFKKIRRATAPAPAHHMDLNTGPDAGPALETLEN